MSNEDFVRCMAKLTAAFREKVEDATMEVYYERLARFDLLTLDLAVTRCIDINEYFPKVAQLLAVAQEIQESKQLALRPPPVNIPWEEDEYRKRLRRLDPEVAS